MSGDGYEYDNEDDGMRAALERQRKKPTHVDEAVSLLSKDERPAADVAHDAMAPAKPYGPVEPPPSEPPSVAPSPEAPPEQPFKPNDLSVQTSAPKADPKLAALGTLSKFIDAGTFPTIAGLGDGDIAAAQERDRGEVRRNNFTKAISSGLLRKPYEPDAAPEAPGLLARRQLADQGQARQLSAQEKLVAALKGEEPKPLDPSLVALHEASAAQLRELAAQRDSREKRDAEEQKRKTDVATTTKTAEDASLESQRAIMTADPRLKKLGITPEVLAKLDRKGLEDVARELGPKGATAPNGPGGKMLPADQVAQLGDYETASKSVDELLKTHGEKGMSGAGARAANLLPQSGPLSTPFGLGSDTAEYNDKAKATAQVVGYILEGGKLSDADVPRYLKMLPGPGDPPERAAEKAANIHHLLQEKKAGRLKTFGAAGYRTPGDGVPSSGGHGKVVKETKSVRQYEDGFLESKT